MDASGQAKYETTAAVAESEASTQRLSNAVHQNAEIAQEVAKKAAEEAQHHDASLANQPAGTTTTAAQATAQQPGVAGTAEHAKGVAEHAASVAHERGPGATGDLTDAIPALQAKTGQAVEQGKADAQGYVQQAINLANSAVNSASQYISGSAQNTEAVGGTTTGNLTQTASSTASSALETAKQYAGQAQQVAQPHLEAAAKALQSGATTAVAAAQDAISGTGTRSAGAVDSKTAPLETGPHTTDQIYPEGEDAKKFAKTA